MMNNKLDEMINKIIKSDSRIVVCDWDRCLGKTTASIIIANKLVKDGKTVTILYRNKNILRCTIANNISIDNRVVLKTIGEIKGLNPTDYVIYDDVNNVYNNKNELEYFSKMCCKIIVFSTFKYNDVEIIKYSKDDLLNSNKPYDEITLEDFKKHEIQKLMKEFSSIPNTENTITTRERILNMIQTIKEM